MSVLISTEHCEPGLPHHKTIYNYTESKTGEWCAYSAFYNKIVLFSSACCTVSHETGCFEYETNTAPQSVVATQSSLTDMLQL